LVIACLLQIPEPIVTDGGAGPDIVSGEFPASGILEDDGQGIWAFVADEILDGNGILANGQSRDIKFSGAGVHDAGAEDPAIKGSVGAGIGAGIQQVDAADLRFGDGEGVFVFCYGARDAAEIGLQ